MFARRSPATVSLARSLTAQRFGSSLVLVEHDGAALSPAMLSTFTASKQLGDITAVVFGTGCDSVAEAASKVDGVGKVLKVDIATPTAEVLADTLAALQKSGGFTHIIAPATSYGKNALPRAGAILDVQPISDVIEIKDENTFVRPIYAGDAIATVQSNDPVKIVTVRATSFDKAAAEGGSASIENAAAVTDNSGLAEFVGKQVQESARPDLTAASIVVSGGRALKSAENFSILETLADKLGGAVGASRAAVDAGYAANELQVGQTGKIVAPELYFAVGISGAIQHVAGMKDSKTIVAINNDPDAAIFQIADYGLVADLFKAIPEMTEKV